VTVLDRTVVTSGRLFFEAPDTFVRETLKPSRDRLAVTGNTLTMSRGDRSRTCSSTRARRPPSSSRRSAAP
jgi:outer membrane lipoprotein-sorting protein